MSYMTHRKIIVLNDRALKWDSGAQDSILDYVTEQPWANVFTSYLQLPTQLTGNSDSGLICKVFSDPGKEVIF